MCSENGGDEDGMEWVRSYSLEGIKSERLDDEHTGTEAVGRLVGI